MSNPIYRLGPISKDPATAVQKARLVRLVGDGHQVELAQDTGAVFGAVTEKADPEKLFSAPDVAVHYGPGVVALSIAGGGEIAAGAAVYAAADGEVSGTGTVQVGVAHLKSENGLVETILNQCPVAG